MHAGAPQRALAFWYGTEVNGLTPHSVVDWPAKGALHTRDFKGFQF
jgi:hypothetical protein